MEQWFYELSGTRQGPKTEAEIHDLFKAGLIDQTSLVWSGEFGAQWTSYVEAFPNTFRNAPPAATGFRSHEVYGWSIALLSLLAGILDKILLTSGVSELTDTILDMVAWPCVSGILAWLDTRAISHSGRNPRRINLLAWFWLTPVYLWQRARVLSQPKTLLFVWLVTGLLSLILAPPKF